LFRSAFDFFDRLSIFAMRAKNLRRARVARAVPQKTAGKPKRRDTPVKALEVIVKPSTHKVVVGAA